MLSLGSETETDRSVEIVPTMLVFINHKVLKHRLKALSSIVLTFKQMDLEPLRLHGAPVLTEVLGDIFKAFDGAGVAVTVTLAMVFACVHSLVVQGGVG